jgi:predicted metal-dependent HD superfamily phosphohydrolase
MNIVTQAEKYVRELLTAELTKDHRYHNLTHTLMVREKCIELSDKLSLNEEEREILQLAALFHDTGFTKVYTGHEEVSKEIAEAFLEEYKYPQEKLDKILACIGATKVGVEAEDQLEEVIQDADLNNLGSGRYGEVLAGLRHEWKVFLGREYTDEEWHKMNYQFIKNHEYHTEVAKEDFEEPLQENLKSMKKMVKKDKKKKDKKKGAGQAENGIGTNKGAQMMFKTALRNHLDLTNLADNKANIMLSVNALIITVAMPLAASFAQGMVNLLFPIASLLLFCLISMIFATMATRPIKMHGMTQPNLISEKKSNLFFFGNFYNMNYNDYEDGMRQVIKSEDLLETSIMRDLYFLGKTLGKKYSLLRLCYTIFMIGITVSVIIFVIVYADFIASNPR